MIISSNRILRIRPGNLANFSGGGGFMPWIAFLSLPSSFLCTLLSIIFMQVEASASCSNKNEAGVKRIDLVQFGYYIKKHIIVCLILTLTAGAVLYYMGYSLLSRDKVLYIGPTLLMATGPMAAFFVSTLVLGKKLISEGPGAAKAVIAFIVYIALSLIFILLGYMWMSLV